MSSPELPRRQLASPPPHSLAAEHQHDDDIVLDNLHDDLILGVPDFRVEEPAAAHSPARLAPQIADLSRFKGMTEPSLTDQQRQVLAMVVRGESVFFTGPAGSGKSVLLRAIIKEFSTRHEQDRVNNRRGEKSMPAWRRGSVYQTQKVEEEKWTLAVTASTGTAAVNIGGCTLHSWAGIGLGEDTEETLAFKIIRSVQSRERWQRTSALVIDEISMINGFLFEKLDFIGQRVRGNNKPFGGLQLILCGDFFQLPPVRKDEGPPVKFAFQAQCWSAIFSSGNMVALDRVFRQIDPTFVDLLGALRIGDCSDQDTATLTALEREIQYPHNIEPVVIYPRKESVRNLNDLRFRKLPGQIYSFPATDTPGVDSYGRHITHKRATDDLDRTTMWPALSNFRVGSMVMLIMNMGDNAYVNGSCGLIVDFMTLGEAGQTDVYIPCKNGKVRSTGSPDIKYPVIEFYASRYASGTQYKRVLISANKIEMNNAHGSMQACREQVPLILAWAMTVHKSQGQTIERLRIDLGGVFVAGQTYVAISRAVAMDSLEIINFSPDSVKADETVLQWAAEFDRKPAKRKATMQKNRPGPSRFIKASEVFRRQR